MKAKARPVALFSRSGIAGTEALRVDSPETSLGTGGRSAASLPRRVALAAAVAAAFLLLTTSQALAEIVVELSGSGSGSVGSDPAGIECSNLGATPPGPDCSETFPTTDAMFEPNLVELEATPAADSYFAGWSGDDPNFLGLATCNSGSENPCGIVDTAEFFGNPPVHITATFEPLPDPPLAVTGGTSPGASEQLLSLEGTVNPSSFEVSECRFEYGPTTAYGRSAPCTQNAAEIGEGSVPVPVGGEAELEWLRPGTTYHYRLVVANVSGVDRGEDRTFTTASAPEGDCANAAIREAQPFAALLPPGCMALEMVSPPNKGGQSAFDPHVSAGGGRVIFRSAAALGGTSGNLNVTGDPYVATRGAAGWSTAATSPPAERDIVGGWGSYANAESFAPDFSRWFQIGSTISQLQIGETQAFEGGLGGLFAPLSPVIAPLLPAVDPTIEGGRFDVTRSAAQGASADRSHLYFNPGPRGTGGVVYLPGDPEPSGSAATTNAYVAHLDDDGDPALELLARDGMGKAWGNRCGARLPIGAQGAVSSDGSRVYFTTRPAQPAAEACSSANKLRILQRLESKQGAWIGELFSSECDRVAPACSAADGDDHYQAASVDGTRVYFTTTRQLADSDLDSGSSCGQSLGSSAGCDLYLYDSALPHGQRLIQVSAGEAGAPSPGEGAGVLRAIAAVSGDGSHVYFVAQGILTSDPGPEGSSPLAGQANLYAWDRGSEQTSFIGTLSTGDLGQGTGLAVPELGEDETGRQVGGDGHILPIRSSAPLTADDGDGGRADIFLYDADAGQLLRVSKAAAGAADNGAFDVVGGTNVRSLGTDFAERGRRVSEDGESVVFATAEGLVPGDLDGEESYYLWRQGQLYRLPGTVDELGGMPALSHDGSTVAVPTSTPLLPEDGDVATDVYALRVEGGYPRAASLAQCEGEACRGPAGSPPPLPLTPSTVPGAGNLTSRPPGCSRAGRRAQRLSRRAKHLRRQARRLSAPRKAKRMHRRAKRLAAKARGASRSAKRCRQDARRAAR